MWVPGCKNWPALFPGRMSYKATKPGLVSVLYLSMFYSFYVLLVYVGICSVFWLFWLSCHYLPRDWVWKTPPKKPNRGEGIVSTKPRPKSVHGFLVECTVSLFYDVCFVPRLYVIYFVLLWHILFVLNIPLNTKSAKTLAISRVTSFSLCLSSSLSLSLSLSVSLCVWGQRERERMTQLTTDIVKAVVTTKIQRRFYGRSTAYQRSLRSPWLLTG